MYLLSLSVVYSFWDQLQLAVYTYLGLKYILSGQVKTIF